MINRILKELDGETNGQRRSPERSDEANQLAETVARQATQIQRYAEKMITSHPVAALTVAVVAGLAIGWWVKRK